MSAEFREEMVIYFARVLSMTVSQLVILDCRHKPVDYLESRHKSLVIPNQIRFEKSVSLNNIFLTWQGIKRRWKLTRRPMSIKLGSLTDL